MPVLLHSLHQLHVHCPADARTHPAVNQSTTQVSHSRADLL